MATDPNRFKRAETRATSDCPHEARERDVCSCNDPIEGPQRPPRRQVRWTDLAQCMAIALTPGVAFQEMRSCPDQLRQ